MARTQPSDLGIVLTFLREGQGWGQTELATAAGTSPSLINDYEGGRKELKRERLEHLASFLGVPPERIDETLSCLEGNRAASRSPHSPSSIARRRIESIAAQAARMVADFVRSLLLLLTREGEALHDRQSADFLWRKLLRRNSAQRLMLVEDAPEYRNWALCERVCFASIEAAPNHPREALALAELAVHIAKLAPGEAATRRNLEGYALAHLSNAWRVCNNLQAMETTIARALKLWDEGDLGLLNPAVVPWIEAAVRKDQRKLKEALRKIDEALRLDSGELRGKILFTKSFILDAVGDSELSTAVLYEAAPLIDGKKEPRLAFGLEVNLLRDLCRLGRATEAAPRLHKVRQLAEQMGEKLDLARVVWLGGLVDAGLGHVKKAEAAFRQVRHEVEAFKLPYDYALVSLDLSLTLLEQGRNGEVRAVAEEMLVIFQSLKIDREALMAIQVFCEAASREAVTLELTQRVAQFLRRAQSDPELKFEEAAGTGAS